MSDEKLRQLERKWRETRATQDEAAYLLERMRVGSLAPERLSLAAYCGHPSAKAALCDRAPVEFKVLPRSPTDEWDYQARESFRAFLERLLKFGEGALVQGIVGCGWFTLPSFEAVHPGDARARRALEMAEVCLGAPSADDLANAADAAEGATLASQSHLPAGSQEDGSFLDLGPSPPQALVADLAGHVCRLAVSFSRSEIPAAHQTWDHVLNDLIELLTGTRVQWTDLAAACARRVAGWALR